MDLMKMMKQAQEIQGRMQQMQEELAGLEVEGKSGAGLVTVKLTGKLDLRSLKIDPSLIKPEDAEMLEDLIVAAFQDAKAKAEQYAKAAGRSLGEVVSIAENVSTPTPTSVQYDARAAAVPDLAKVPIQPGSQNVSVSVSVVFAMG